MVTIKGHQYYRAYVENADGKLISVYGKTLEELCEKFDDAEHRSAKDIINRKSPTVKEYAEKWLLMQSANIRQTTLIDYTSKVKRHIIAPLGHMRMADVTADDIKLALVPVAKKSASVFKSVNILYKCIFNSAEDSRIITYNPTRFLSTRGGGVPQREKEALTDAQAAQLIETVRDLPPYVFVMLGLYAGLRREEILALKWECVFLDTPAPYISVRRAWHTENNRPVIMTELKTPAARRDIAIPVQLAECLREARESASSEYVVANSEGQPLSYTQFKLLWRYITVRTARPRIAKKKVGGQYVKYTLYPKLGEKARNNGRVEYSLDFEVTPHQLRHTYITNLIAAGVDPKTVQYLAGHENSKITMDIYAKVKYNRPEDVVKALRGAFDIWNSAV
jgi:integrase